jgi:hypothetical protein
MKSQVQKHPSLKKKHVSILGLIFKRQKKYVLGSAQDKN